MASVEGMKRFSGDPAFRFFYGMALVLEGRVQEGIRELDPLQGYSEVMLGSLLALIHAHKQCLTVDKEAVAAYDAKLKEERKRADDQGRTGLKVSSYREMGGHRQILPESSTVLHTLTDNAVDIIEHRWRQGSRVIYAPKL